ncbi:MAG TPA: hypothetical protein VGC42_27200, partial [Kofleriaceae bacterium]
MHDDADDALDLAPETTGDRFSVPSLARPGRQARVVDRKRPVDRKRSVDRKRARAGSLEGSTVRGYAPAPYGPDHVTLAIPAAFARGSISPEPLAFPPEPVTEALAYTRAPRARGSAPQLSSLDRPSASTTHVRHAATFTAVQPPAALVWRASGSDAERTLCVRPLPSPVPSSLATRAARALRSRSFATRILLPVLVGAILGLVAML